MENSNQFVAKALPRMAKSPKSWTIDCFVHLVELRLSEIFFFWGDWNWFQQTNKKITFLEFKKLFNTQNQKINNIFRIQKIVQQTIKQTNKKINNIFGIQKIVQHSKPTFRQRLRINVQPIRTFQRSLYIPNCIWWRISEEQHYATFVFKSIDRCSIRVNKIAREKKNFF